MHETLKIGRSVRRSIQPGGRDTFAVELEGGSFAEVCVRQGPADLIVTVNAPDDRQFLEIDGAEYGPELVGWEAEGTGTYTIVVWALSQDVNPADYSILLRAVGGAAPTGGAFGGAPVLATRAKRLARGHVWGDRLEAAALHTEAARIYQSLSEIEAWTATRVSLGFVRYSLGEHAAALDLFRQGLESYRRLKDRYGETMMLNAVGGVSRGVGLVGDALKCLTNAYEYCKALGVGTQRAAVCNNLAMFYTEVGEWNLALRFYDEALELTSTTGVQKGVAFIANNRASIYSALGDNERAVADLERAVEALRILESPPLQARSLVRLAQVKLWMMLGLEALEIADRVDREFDVSGDPRLEGDLLCIRAGVAEHDGRFDEAFDLYTRAARSRGQIGIPAREADALELAGSVAHKLGRMEVAREQLEKALELARGSDLRDMEARVLNTLATVEFNDGRWPSALRHAEAAVSLVGDLRTKTLGHELRASYFAARQDYIATLTEVLMESTERDRGKHARQAFEVGERSRARGLLELLNEHGAEVRSGIDSGLMVREREVTYRQGQLARQLAGLHEERKNSERERVTKELDEAERERRHLEETIRKKSPALAALAMPESLGIQEIQQSLLDPKTVFLQYSFGQQTSYAWVVGIDSFESFRLGSRARVESAAWRLWSAISKRPPSRGDRSYAMALAVLGELLIQPLALSLTGRRVLVSTEGWLQYVPFGALAISDSGPRLLDCFEVVSVPSASTLSMLRRRERSSPPSRRLMVFADPRFHPPSGARSQPEGGPRAGRPRLRPLPFSKAEAEDIRTLLPPGQISMALGSDANRERLTSDELANYRIVHLSTHAQVDDNRPELSWIALSQFGDDGSPMDGALYLPEVYDLRLSADLVVLSACSTALGRQVRGEGLLGLTRAFLYAGARSVIATLWEVDNQASARLVGYFFRALLQGEMTPSAALQEAQSTLAAEPRWNHPHFWAGFVLVGDYWQDSYDE